MAASAPRHRARPRFLLRPVSPSVLRPEPDRPLERLARRHVEPGLGASSRRSSRGESGPLGDDPGQLADRPLRPLVAQQRQRDPLAAHVGERDVDDEQALLEQRRREQRLRRWVRSPRSRPRSVIDSSTPTRLQNTTNDVVSWA